MMDKKPPAGERLLALSAQQQKAANAQAHDYDALKIQAKAAGLLLTEMLAAFLQTKRQLAELGLTPPDLLDHTAERAAQLLEPKSAPSFKFPPGSTIGAN